MIWHGFDEADEPSSDKNDPIEMAIANLGSGDVTPAELEEAIITDQARPTLLINSVVIGLTLTLLIGALGAGWRNLAQEFSIDGSFTRLALVAATPVQIFVSLVGGSFPGLF
jgi:hypothetical protein